MVICLQRRICAAAFIISLCVFALNQPILGRAWYANRSADSATADGSAAHPYVRIQQAAGQMGAGDTCYIRAGTYRESVRPANSGTSATAPIVFIAYQNEKVTISGCDLITGWTVYNDSMYRATYSPVIQDLFVNSQYMLWARFPNAPYDSLIGFDMLRLPEGTAAAPTTIDYTNVTLMKDGQSGWVRQIIRQSTSGIGQALMGVLGLLNAPGEWYQGSGTVYLFPPKRGSNPAALAVEGKVRDYGFDLSTRNYIVLKKLTVFGASVNMNGAQRCVMDSCENYYNCTMFYVSGDRAGFHRDNGNSMSVPGKGIIMSGSYNEVRNCTIAHTWGDGITIFGTYNTVTNCHIYDCNWSGTDCACIGMSGSGHAARYNTLHDAGRSILVHRRTSSSAIEYNDMSWAGLLTDDMGVTYTFNSNGGGSTIAYNWVHHAFPRSTGAAGIYLDNNTSGFNVHHNVVWCIKTGIASAAFGTNAPNTNELYCNNTTYNNALPRTVIDSATGYTNFRVVNWLCDSVMPRNISFTMQTNYSGTQHRMVAPDYFHFELAAGSPCIDAGTGVSPYTTGYAGSAPDIGAYEYGKTPWRPGCSFANIRAAPPALQGILSKKNWVANASVNTINSKNMLDGRIDTRWETRGPQVSGQQVLVNLQTQQKVNKIALDAAPMPNDWPRGYEIYISADGSTWGAAVATGSGTAGLTTIIFRPATGRYVKIVQTGSATVPWSVYEFYAYYDSTLSVVNPYRKYVPSPSAVRSVSVFSLDGRCMARWHDGDSPVRAGSPMPAGNYILRAVGTDGVGIDRRITLTQAGVLSRALREALLR